MTLTRKFSQFVGGGLVTPTDEPVGLEAGANTIWTGAGSGGGGVTQQLPQPSPPVSVGQWLKVTPTSGLYTGAQGDNADDAEVIGLVVLADATNFTLQQSGYVTSAMAVVSGLTAGMGYFISTANPGVMVPTDAVVNGQVSRPVFVADSPTSGWIVPYRGLIVGGAAPSGGGGSSTDSNIVNVTQTAHGFVPGNVVRVSTANTSGAPISYALAQANTLANAQSVGVVLLNPAPTTNTFSLQFAGYNTGSLTVDQAMAALTPATVYYLSSTVAGAITSTDPGLSGGVSRPIYISEQGIINAGTNSGYILPQRPLTINSTLEVGSVLLTTQNISNGTSIVSFNNILSSTYNCYQVILENILPNASPVRLDMRVGTGSTPTYQTSGYLGWTYWGASTGMNYFGQQTPVSSAQVNNGLYMNNVPTYRSAGQIYIYDVNDSTPTYIQTRFQASNYNVVNPIYPVPTLCQGSLMWNNTTAITSLQFLFSSGTFYSGRISIYGINQ